MLSSSQAKFIIYPIDKLETLTKSRLKAFRRSVYENKSSFYCRDCREYHIDMFNNCEKEMWKKLQENISRINKVLSSKV